MFPRPRGLFLLLALVSAPERGLAQEAAAGVAASDAVQAAVPSVEQLISLARKTMAATQDYTGVLVREERVDGKLVKQINRFKFAKPFKVYLYFVEPHKGREAIFVRGWNDGEIRVHKGSFPDISLNLDPLGSTALNGKHHPIHHFGFEYMIELVDRNLSLAKKHAEGETAVSDGGKVAGEAVWKIDVRFPKKGWMAKAREDETLWHISKRTGQDMNWILYSNRSKGWDEPDDVDEDDPVFIPRYYGHKAEFYVVKDTGLPVKSVVWDWSGRLYERYSYRDVKLNPGLTRADFDPNNPKYNF